MKTLLKIIVLFSVVAILFNGCGGSGGGGSTPTVINNAPVATQLVVTKSITEASSLTYDIRNNVTDSDNDDLNVTSLIMADGSALPNGISLIDNNLTVANTISVADGQNLTYDLNATVSDGKDYVTYSLKVVIQDRSNDSLLTYTVNIATSIDSNETLSGNILLADSDGLSSNSYSFELLDRNDSNNSVYTGSIDDVGSDGNYTFSIDLNASSVGSGHYVFKTSAISPVIGGENPQSDVVITHNFQVFSTPTIAMATQTINDNGGFATTDLPAPTVSNIDTDAVYSIVSDPTGGKLTINASTGVTTWNGDINPTQVYTITIKVINPDGRSALATFTLNVTDNG